MTAFFSIIENVAETLTGSPRAVELIASVEAGSNQIHVDPVASLPSAVGLLPMISRTVNQGVSVLHKQARKPKGFGDEALQSARDLGALVDGRGIDEITITFNDVKAPLSMESAANIDRLMGLGAIEDFGAIEGRLEILSMSGPHFGVRDEITRELVRCEIPENRINEAISKFGGRVIVTGRISYRAVGNFRPARIVADRIDWVSPETEPPASYDEVYGLLSKA